MKKIIFCVSQLAIVSAFCAASAIAEDAPKSFYIAPEIAYVLPTDGDVNDTVFLGGKVGYHLDPNWAIEVESGWMEPGIDTDIGDIDITVVPIVANLRYNVDKQSWGNLYFFAGVGAAINDLETDVDTDLQVDDSVVWQVGMGAQTPLSDGLDGFIDIRYFANEPDISESGAASSALLPSDANLQAIFFTAGLSF